MDLSNAQHQNMATHSLEDVMGCPKPQQEKKLRPQPEHALKCPRCDSTNTKFCYYNNYSLSQPRYFCKACRRYWTKGGSLRNVPVGGGCRKNKRSSSSKRPQDQALTTNPTPLPTLPPLTYDSNDLTLAFARLHNQPTRQLGLDDHDTSIMGNPNTIHCDVLGNHNTNTNITSTTPTTASFLDAMRSGFLDGPSALHNNYYYGFGNGSIGEVEGLCGGGEVILPYEEMGTGASATTTMATTTTTKQEFCKSGDLENKVFWGMQWQLGGDGNMVNDTGRDYWNGIGSSWHGLVNGPLV